jgi:hypothetical protein
MNPEGRQDASDRRGGAPVARGDSSRCINIPARYCTGDLSDIEVPPLQTATDVHAWFEACLGAGWPHV